jgi:hypothetical protein
VQPTPKALIGDFATNHCFRFKFFGQLATP